ncbi:hypothetical protein DSCW_60090 [Desulfosarcina widdelii]|uniref:HDOD domain-containing protein n=1 Tax=Desulfosarcina widdelii TaxID=947919 RepID=A0A5K7Z983_9BACT|nr:hypothetical protein [Desulfosarcina widdelii]BBO78592.1 hypothetical protein DSCW_60090 [Desulfosarcina widdelii]
MNRTLKRMLLRVKAVAPVVADEKALVETIMREVAGADPDVSIKAVAKTIAADPTKSAMLLVNAIRQEVRLTEQ